MSYCTQAQLEDRYSTLMLVQLTDRASPKSGLVDTSVVARNLADADAEIDGYLAKLYLLPLTAVPAIVTDLALRVAIYKLHRQTAPDKIMKDYELARADLVRIARGEIVLQAQGVATPAGGAADVRVTDADRTLTVTTLKGYI
jgi:phage gp36-like protein